MSGRPLFLNSNPTREDSSFPLTLHSRQQPSDSGQATSSGVKQRSPAKQQLRQLLFTGGSVLFPALFTPATIVASFSSPLLFLPSPGKFFCLFLDGHSHDSRAWYYCMLFSSIFSPLNH